MRFRVPEIFLGALLATSIFVLGFLAAQQMPVAPINPDQTSSENTAGQSEREYGKAFWQRSITDPVALFTLCIAVFTAVLSFSTIGLWRSTGRLGELSHMALTHLERPFVYVEITKSGIRRRQPTLDRLERDGWLTMSCRNDGRTPADLWELTTEVHAIDETALARPLIPAPIGPRRLPTGTVASPTKPYARYIDDLKQQLGDNWVDVEVGKKLICLLGYLRYRDIFGSHYITGFCYVFDIVGMDFVLRGDDQYNYARQEAG